MTSPILPLPTPSVVTPSPQGSIAELWDNLIPYADLNAKGVPERHLSLGTEILPTLSALTAKGPGGPKMLAADAVGKLATANLPYFVDVATSPGVVGANTINVGTPALYTFGTWILAGKAVTNGQPSFGQFQEVLSVSGSQISGNYNWVSAINPGDPIFILPFPASVYGALRRRIYDWQVFSIPGDGIRATVTIPQKGGYGQIIDKIGADLANGVATAARHNVSLQDPQFAGGTRWVRQLSISNVIGTVDHVAEDSLGFALGDANNHTVVFDAAPPAGVSQSLSVAGYYEPLGVLY